MRIALKRIKKNVIILSEKVKSSNISHDKKREHLTHIGNISKKVSKAYALYYQKVFKNSNKDDDDKMLSRMVTDMSSTNDLLNYINI